MKKYISVFLITLFSAIMTFGAAEAAAPSPIFDLDFKMSGGRAAFSDKSGNFNIDISNDFMKDVGGRPTIKTEDGLSYIRFNQKPVKCVEKDGVNVMENLTEQSAAMWISIDSLPVNYARHPFALVNMSDTSVMMWRYMMYDKYLYYRPGAKRENGAYAEKSIEHTESLLPLQQWNFMVFTKKWKDENTFVYETYINGQKTDSLSETVSNAIHVDENGVGLYIGANMRNTDKLASMTIYNKALTEDMVAEIYADDVKKYNPPSESMDLSEVNPADNSTISSSGGEIQIEFNNYIDKSSLKTVKMIYSDGNEVEGGIIKNISPDGKSFKILFGELKQNENVTIILDGIVSENGYTSSCPELNFLTDSGFIADYTFDGDEFSEGETVSALNGIAFESTGGNGAVVMSDDTGNKYISMMPEKVNSDARLTTTLNTSLDNQTELVCEMRVRTNNINPPDGYVDNSSRDIARIYSSGGANKTVASLSATQNQIIVINKQYNRISKKDSDGFYNLKLVFKKNQSGYIDVYVTDKQSNETYTVNTELTDIKSIILTHIYTEDAATLEYDRTEVDDVKLYYNVPPYIIGTVNTDIGADEEKIELLASGEIDKETVSNQSVILSKADGTKIECDVELSGEYDGRRIVVMPKSYLDYNQSYNISVDGIAGINETMFTSKLIGIKTVKNEMSVQNVSVVSEADDVSVSADIENNSDFETDVKLIGVLYDDTEVLGVYTTDTAINAKDRKTAVLNVDTDKYNESSRAVLYVWKNINGVFKTLTTTELYIKNQ